MDETPRRGPTTPARLAAALFVLLAALVVAAPAGGATREPGPGPELAMHVGIRELSDGSLQVVRGWAPRGVSTAASASSQMLAWEPEVTYEALFVDDPHRPLQWALDATHLEQAWRVADGTGVVVAVIDTGVRKTHEDLAGALVAGTDMISPGGDGSGTDHFHATHVSGIIAARTGNGLGIAGVAPGAKVLNARALNGAGKGNSADVAEAILHATDRGARIINLSLGSTTRSSVVKTAIDHAVAKGVLVVAASGNSGRGFNPVIYPAAEDGVLAVGALTRDLQRAGYSSYGSWLDLVAPGDSITSLHHSADDRYANASGTSMAAPFVSGVAALALSANPDLTPDELAWLLQATATDVGPSGRDPHHGAGMVDPIAAVKAASGLEPGLQLPSDGFLAITSRGRTIGYGTALAGGADGNASVPASLAAPVVGATSASDAGHLMVAADGGIFAFGDATFHGSMGGQPLNAPVVGMAATPTGNGYWLVAADGGIFAFGDATFHGSAGALPLRSPMVTIAPSPSGGYWSAAADGGIFAFGDAPFLGSAGSSPLDGPVSALLVVDKGTGYRMVTEHGQVVRFGSASAEAGGAVLTPGERVVALVPA